MVKRPSFGYAWYRLDEIFAGTSLALLMHQGWFAVRFEIRNRWSSALVLMLLFSLLVASSHPHAGFLNFLRPYLAMAAVGVTLYNPSVLTFRGIAGKGFVRVGSYVAAVSYALYVLHVPLAETWLGGGEGWYKYLVTRPLMLCVLLALSHVSTFYFERPILERVKSATT